MLFTPSPNRSWPKQTAWLLLWSMCLALGTEAQAGIADTYVGTRTLAMGGAQRGLGQSNEVLLLNPAAMAALQRYSAEMSYTTGSDHEHRLLLTTVDSKSGKLAAGVSYGRLWGRPSAEHPALGELRIGLAYPILPVLSVGVSGQNISGHYYEQGEAQKVRAFNGTLGAMLHLGSMLGFGFSWENFARRNPGNLMPRALGFGAGLSVSLLRLAADLRLLPQAGGPYRRELHTGGEVSLARVLLLRGGYRLAQAGREEPARRQQYITAGFALALGGLSIDAAMEKPLATRQWRVATGLSWIL